MSNKTELLLEVASGLALLVEKELSSRHHDSNSRLNDPELLLISQAVSQMVFDAYQQSLNPAK